MLIPRSTADFNLTLFGYSVCSPCTPRRSFIGADQPPPSLAFITQKDIDSAQSIAFHNLVGFGGALCESSYETGSQCSLRHSQGRDWQASPLRGATAYRLLHKALTSSTQSREGRLRLSVSGIASGIESPLTASKHLSSVCLNANEKLSQAMPSHSDAHECLSSIASTTQIYLHAAIVVRAFEVLPDTLGAELVSLTMVMYEGYPSASHRGCKYSRWSPPRRRTSASSCKDRSFASTSI